MRASAWLTGVAIAAAVTAHPDLAQAQPSYEVIRSFARPPEEPAGSPIEAAPGVFAVPMRRGGAYDRGAILRFDRQANGALIASVLHAFNGADGAAPGRLMRGNDGALYGTTRRGGPNDEGTAFRLTLGGQLTTLHPFSGDQAFPNGLMLRTASGDFYGTLGGEFPVIGQVFRLTPAGSLTIVAISLFPATSLQDVRLAESSTGDLYGIYNHSFFRMQPDGQAVLIRSLSDQGYTGATNPLIVAGTDGNFYVNLTDTSNLPAQPDIIVRLTPAGAFSILRAFPTPVNVFDLFEATDGNLYGVAAAAAQAFRLTKRGAFMTLHTFSYWDGSSPIGLMQASDTRLYGSTIGGGTSNRGTLFEISGTGVAVRSHFSDPTPLNPAGTLMRGVDGLLYGTSCGGGDYNSGTVFKVTDTGVLTVVHAFRYWDGVCPTSGLTRTADGSLWGTARGSLIGRGTVFKISSAGVFSLMHIFGAGDGGRPVALLLASDGNLYGTTTSPDSQTSGTVFRMTPAGAFTVLHAFSHDASVRLPYAGLAEGADGALYGTGFEGTGAFRLTVSGDYTEYPFIGTGIAGPLRLLRGTTGDFYGGTAYTEIVQMTPTGTASLLYGLSGSDGARVLGDLMQATDGRLYGAAWEGGVSNAGTIFRLTTAGLFEKLHDFSSAGGANPFGGLLEATPGTFYGTTVAGGPGNGGVIFRLVMNPPPF